MPPATAPNSTPPAPRYPAPSPRRPPSRNASKPPNPGSTATFRASYAPTSAPFTAQSGTLEHWLTERYCLYARRPDGTLLRTEVHHAPWPLQRAAGKVEVGSLLDSFSLNVGWPPPLLHFARRLDVVVWPPERLV